MIHATLQPRGIDVDAEARPLIHGDREGLSATHATNAAGERQGAGQGPAELLVGHGGKGLVRALQDALRADVDPRPRRHLPVHREPKGLQAAKLGPGGPIADEIRVRDEHAGRPLVRLKDTDGAS